MPLTPRSQRYIKDDSVELREDTPPSSASEPHYENCEKSNQDVDAGQAEKQLDARSTVTTDSVIPPPPDGGLHAWLKVLGGFLIYINIWSACSALCQCCTNILRGFTLSYGAFQAYYKSNLLASSSPSAISWIGTVQAWLLIVIGVLSGPLFDLGYFRSMLLVGNFLVVFGIMMLSLSKTYVQVFLSQGLCMGLGAGLLYIPSLALVGIWFDKKRALALGIVMSGIAVGVYPYEILSGVIEEHKADQIAGGVVYIIMFDHLLQSSGFPWAIRSIGFVALAAALLSIPALLSGSKVLATRRKARALFDTTAFHDRLFLVFTCCSFSTFLGYIVPYFYIPTYARERLGTSDSLALYMLVMSVAGSFFGRLVSGFLAQYLGAIVTWGLCTFASGILSFCWISIEKESTFIAFSVLWGNSSYAQREDVQING
jgi:MFS family permease